MVNCVKKVTTSSGTFTFFDEEVQKCEARKKCEEKGQILAPILNAEDATALQAVCDETACEFHNHFRPYHIGLDILTSKCGNKPEKVFTNGVRFDEAVHGKIYREIKAPFQFCRHAVFNGHLDIGTTPLTIAISRRKCADKYRYICLKPVDEGASPLLSENSGNPSFAYLSYASMCVAFVAVITMIRLWRKYKVAEDGNKKWKEYLTSV